MSELNSQQFRTKHWVIKCFGFGKYYDSQERGLRLVEEAMETAQSLGVTESELHRLLGRVYSRPIGELRQELAGTAVCLLAAAGANNVKLSEALEEELWRLENTDFEFFRKKNREKEADGVSVGHRMPA